MRFGKFGKARLLPLHASTGDSLRDYLRVRDRLRLTPVTDTLFVSTAGTRMDQSRVSKIFNRLTRQVGLVPRSASCRPASMIMPTCALCRPLGDRGCGIRNLACRGRHNQSASRNARSESGGR